MKRIKTYLIFVLNWLKNRNNLILVLLFVLALSVFKIAFFGIETHSIIESDDGNPIDVSTDATVHTATNDPLSVEKY